MGKLCLESATVLILEDSAAAALSARLAVGEMGANVIIVSCYEEAEAFLANGPRVDLLIVDLMLPDGDGVEFIELARRRYGQTIPVIITSAMADPEVRAVGLLSGADDCLGKPFSTRELQARIRNIALRYPRWAADRPALVAS